jgi:hypothetical protein
VSKELWYHITPPADTKDEEGWCPASTVQVFLDDGWIIDGEDYA